MASYQESTYIARTVEHAFISELTGEMIQNRNRKIDVLETLMGDSFGYDYVTGRFSKA